MNKDTLSPFMEFVNETFHQSKTMTFKRLFFFFALGIGKLIFLLASLGGVFWIIRNI